jgi:hypothetical protein
MLTRSKSVCKRFMEVTLFESDGSVEKGRGAKRCPAVVFLLAEELIEGCALSKWQ